MPWIPVWFDDDQWFDLIANFRPVRDLAQLEQRQRAAEFGLPFGYSFDAYYTPKKETLPPPTVQKVTSEDSVHALFVNASSNVFQRLIGTTLQLMEEVRAGNELQLLLPDGKVRRMVMSVPEEQRRDRFRGSSSTAPEA